MNSNTRNVDHGWPEVAIAASSVLCGGLKAALGRYMRPAVSSRQGAREAVKSLSRYGYAVFPHYYTSGECARGRMEIDAILATRPDAIQSFGEGADLRVYGTEHASGVARQFHDNPFLLEVGRVYRRGPLTNFSTLGARLTAKPGNIGSGQGWHRDAFHFQYKAMLYLSDTGPDNGPFQILPGSHRPLRVVRDTLVGRLDKPPSSRIRTEQIARLLAAEPDRALSLPGAAGTVILFDSSTIHRGMPIHTGVRYALTNYFYPPAGLTPAFRRQFEPLITA